MNAFLASPHRRPVLVPILCSLLLSGCFAGVYAQSRSHVLAKRAELSARIDSLQMVKQEAKRKGESLADLDEQTRALQDSVTALRETIANLPDSEEETPAKLPLEITAEIKKRIARLSPQNTFDWLIIGVGVVAVLSALTLLLSVFRAALRRNQPPRKAKPKPAKTKFVPPTPAPPIPKTSEMGGDADTIDESSLRVIRQRMDDDIERIQRFNSGPAPLSDAAGEGGADSDALREQIVQAARDGMGVNQIMRRFQVSADQVTLILRVAQKNNRPAQ